VPDGRPNLADDEVVQRQRALRRRPVFRYKMPVPKAYVEFTLVRDDRDRTVVRAMAMFNRSDCRAMTRGALAFSGAALILGTLLLLSAP